METQYYIVRNLKTNEFWVAEPKYENEFDDIINKLKTSYGDKSILYYPSSIEVLKDDIEFEERNGYKKVHYTDWEPYFVKQNK